ncbi:MAG: LamG domain-containing protein [Candidatus Liptonbacteria bacterium]|nr:LamG domain-containing protein [Candidatus Liptonbacteria bacterium]
MKSMNALSLKKETSISLVIVVSALLISLYIVFASGKISFAQESDGYTQGLVSEWNGDSVSGGAATDAFGGHNGSIIGGVSVVSGKTGKAFRFDGKTGYITVGNPKDLNFGTRPFAIEADFNWDGGGKSSALNIVRKSNYPGSGPGSGYWLRIGRENKTIEFSVGATTGPEGQSLITAPLAPGVWHHVTASKDYSGAVKLYVDGKSRGTALREAKNTQSTSEAPFTLGAWNDRFGVTELFSGAIEDVSVYKHPLFDEYPVPDLGNCNSQSECRSYCEDSDHFRECIDFVKKHYLASPEEIAKWEEFIDVVSGGGPGGCKNEKQCIAYCEDAAHIVECTDFVAKHNLVSADELEEMQKIAKAVKAGAKLPGACRNKADCVAYCEDTAHAEACVEFAEKAGFISKADAEFVRKAGGKSPGDCARGAKSPEEGKKACSAFCKKAENQNVCMDFAVQIGLLTADDAKELGGGGSIEDFNACLPYIDKKSLSCFETLGKDLFEKLKAGDVPDDIDSIKDMIKKMKEVRSCMNKNTDEQFSKLPPGGLACLEKELGPNPLELIKSGKLSCRQFTGTESRIKACFMEQTRAQLDECLNVSCAEVATCFKKLETGTGEESQSASQLDPVLEKKLKDKLNSCVAAQIKECLAKDCSEIQVCMKSIGQGGSGEQKGESALDPALEQAIQTKMTSCFKQPAEGQQGGGQQGGDQQGGGQQGGGAFGADECSKQGGAWNGTQCDFSQKGADIQKEYCPNFASVPSCSYVGAPDSQNYKYCKECYPNK